MSNGGTVSLDTMRDLLAEAAGGSDFYAPMFLRLSPAGVVTADFEGHISAAGLDLTSGDAEASPDDRKVRWLREADSGLVAEIYGYREANIEFLRLEVDDPDSAREAHILLNTEGAAGGPAIEAYAFSPGDDASALVLDNHGNSDFLLAANSETLVEVLADNGAAVPLAGTTTIDDLTLTLPTGWNSMDVELFAQYEYIETAGGEARAQTFLESPAGTMIGRPIQATMHASAANLGQPGFLTAILSGLSGDQGLRLIGVQGLGTVRIQDRYLWARKRRAS